MAFVVLENTIVYKENGKVLAEAAFPPTGIGTVEIVRTHVDDALRGQGMGGMLMERVAKELRRTKRRALPTCDFAVRWFALHPEYSDILLTSS